MARSWREQARRAIAATRYDLISPLGLAHQHPWAQVSAIRVRQPHRAVWDAYGWPEDEVPDEVEEDVILGRLPALNAARAER
ncbi:MAG TPA: hypothetical protein VD789_03640 [Thermomicrobiales bacterium]|nr:hypothetical protein [Thermomicrobiales bacterium]